MLSFLIIIILMDVLLDNNVHEILVYTKRHNVHGMP